MPKKSGRVYTPGGTLFLFLRAAPSGLPESGPAYGFLRTIRTLLKREVYQ